MFVLKAQMLRICVNDVFTIFWWSAKTESCQHPFSLFCEWEIRSEVAIWKKRQKLYILQEHENKESSVFLPVRRELRRGTGAYRWAVMEKRGNFLYLEVVYGMWRDGQHSYVESVAGYGTGFFISGICSLILQGWNGTLPSGWWNGSDSAWKKCI